MSDTILYFTPVLRKQRKERNCRICNGLMLVGETVRQVRGKDGKTVFNVYEHEDINTCNKTMSEDPNEPE